jgi:hypothetical protein
MTNVCSILVRKPEGKTPLERFRHRGEHPIKMDLLEIWDTVIWLRIVTIDYFL